MTRNRWRMDVAITIGIALAMTAAFADGRIDFATLRPFFDAGAPGHWPHGNEPPWSILYRAAPWITASLAGGGFVVLAAACLTRNAALRRQAAFVILSVVIGPGLLVNGVFKDHWGRPRPRDVVEFGGTEHYSPAPLRGEGGKSFPCGHCSVGFLYGIGWWVWRKRRALAWGSLAAGFVTGVGLGVGRMAAGGHFASDVAWSAFISFAIAHWLYWYVLRIPEHEAGRIVVAGRSRVGELALPVLAAFGGVGVLTALFLTAHGEPVADKIALASLPERLRAVEFSATASEVEIVVADSPSGYVQVAGETHGFGLPGSRLVAGARFVRSPIPTLRYAIEQHGWFTDLDARMSLRIPAAGLERIAVRVGKGDIFVFDRTKAHAVLSGKLRLDLQTGAGKTRVSG